MACLAAVILGGVSLFSLQRTGELQSRADAVQEARASLYRSQVSQQGFLRTSAPAAARAAREALSRTGKALAGIQGDGRQAAELAGELEELQGIFGKVVEATQQMNQSLAQQAREAEELLAHVRQEVVAKVEANRAQAIIMAENPDPNEETLLGLGYILLADMEHLQLAFSRLLINQDLEAFQADRQAVLEGVGQNLKNLKSLLPSLKDQDLAEAAQRMPDMVQSMLANLDTLVQQWQVREEMVERLRGVAGRMSSAMDSYTSQTRETISANRASIQLVTLVVALGAVALVLVLGAVVSRAINRALRRTARRMGRGADQVAAASDQVSGASQSLAQGAGEQASSLEETSASLEQMASMTQQNADNAGQADGLMKEAGQVVAGANRSMGELQEAMAKITADSEEMAKIIKSIDEIAFQTNLLALNAAVEAARAGEAGAGFAVVADEVRNLAMRAAEAARNTSQLIESSIAGIRQGSELASATGESFGQVAESTARVGELVAEIAAASSEQAQGIQQVNQAAGEMDKVTQQVAANAEESAAAAEELSAQAQQMQGMVGELRRLVEGADAGGGAAAPPARDGAQARRRLPAPARQAPGEQGVRASGSGARRPEGRQGSAAEANPRRAIPLEEDDDQDFADF
jgi:methyl-accepting chemotaxis protein